MRWLTPLALLVLVPLSIGCRADKPGSDDDDDGGSVDDGGTDSGLCESGDCDGDGYVDRVRGGTDCDDTDPTVYPGAEETWYDGVDQDCDGVNDYDADGDSHEHDGYGGDDCDDADPTVNPLALEICGDTVDQDCDGTVDEGGCGWGTEHAAGLWYEDDREFLGWAIATDCDLDGDGVLEVLASAPGEAADDVNGVVLTMSEGEELEPDGGVMVAHSEPDAGFGTHLDCSVDFDGDGLKDVMVSAFSEDTDSGERAGATRVYLGPLVGDVLASSADHIFYGTLRYNIGMTVGGGDVTGDGVADIVHGAGDSWSPWIDYASPIEGGVVLVARGPNTESVVEGRFDHEVYIEGQGQGTFSIADFDGDGINDIARPEFGEAGGTVWCGAVYAGADLAEASDGDRFTAPDDAMAVLTCPDRTGTSWDAGWNVDADIDLDDDGYHDVFVSLSNGWAAFPGGAETFPTEIPDAARLEAEFCGLGLRDAAFTRDEDGAQLWAVSLDGPPSCEAGDASFRGRVAVFRDWAWTTYGFEDAWSWVANDPDEFGYDPRKYGTRPVAFSHEAGTRLWWGDPTWTTSPDTPGSNYGRLMVFDLDTLAGAW